MHDFKKLFDSKFGKIFNSFLEAKEEDTKIALKKWLNEPLSINETLYEAILENRLAISKILNDLVKYPK